MISEFVTLLNTHATAINQVLRPDAVSNATADSGQTLGGLVASAVSNRVYQATIPERVLMPNAVFQLVSSRRDEVDGLPIIRTETQLITLRASTIAELDTVADTVRSALLSYESAGNAGAITIDDQAIEAEEVDDLKQFQLHMELTVTHLATASQQLPAVFVYPIRTVAGDPLLNKHPRVLCTDEIAVIIIAKSTTGGLDTAINSVSNIIGKQIGNFPVDYAGGELVRQDGHLTTWRERFTIQSYRAV